MIGGTRPRARALLVALYLLSLPAVATRPHTADEIEYYAFLRSAWFDRDLSFENEYRYFYEHGFTRDPLFKATFMDKRTPTGHAVTYATIGTAVLWAPFFVVADGGVRVARLFGASVAADGYSTPYLAATAYGSTLYGALALVIGAAVARRLTGRPAAAAAVVACLGTPLVFYMYAMPHMSHACSAFAVALFLWVWLRVRAAWTPRGVAALACAGGFMASVREQEAFLVVVPMADYVWTLAETPRRSGALIRDGAVRLGIAALGFVLGVLPQLVAYFVVNGRFAPSPDVSNKMYWTAPWAADVVLSPEHGWFFWTPLAVLAIAGLVGMVISPGGADPGARRIATLLLLAVATQVYVSGSVLSWTLAGAFGQRRFVGLSAVLVVGLAWLLAGAAGWPRRVAAIAVATGIWWNLGLAVQFGENSMNRQRLELVRNARATFLELPRRVPRIAYRYLFDRGSFYRQPRE